MKPFHRSRASLGITRRDFLNGVLLGSGAALLRQQPVLLAGQTPLRRPVLTGMAMAASETMRLPTGTHRRCLLTHTTCVMAFTRTRTPVPSILERSSTWSSSAVESLA